MSRKDYIRIARAIRESRGLPIRFANTTSRLIAQTEDDAITRVAERIAAELAADNYRFDRARFMDATKVRE